MSGGHHQHNLYHEQPPHAQSPSSRGESFEASSSPSRRGFFGAAGTAGTGSSTSVSRDPSSGEAGMYSPASALSSSPTGYGAGGSWTRDPSLTQQSFPGPPAKLRHQTSAYSARSAGSSHGSVSGLAQSQDAASPSQGRSASPYTSAQQHLPSLGSTSVEALAPGSTAPEPSFGAADFGAGELDDQHAFEAIQTTPGSRAAMSPSPDSSAQAGADPSFSTSPSLPPLPTTVSLEEQLANDDAAASAGFLGTRRAAISQSSPQQRSGGVYVADANAATTPDPVAALGYSETPASSRSSFSQLDQTPSHHQPHQLSADYLPRSAAMSEPSDYGGDASVVTGAPVAASDDDRSARSFQPVPIPESTGSGSHYGGDGGSLRSEGEWLRGMSPRLSHSPLSAQDASSQQARQQQRSGSHHQRDPSSHSISSQPYTHPQRPISPPPLPDHDDPRFVSPTDYQEAEQERPANQRASESAASSTLISQSAGAPYSPQRQHQPTGSIKSYQSQQGAAAETAPPVGFDEGVLRGLCDLDCGMPLLLDRLKQTMASAKEASAFLKKRAQIEEEYAKAMIKLSRSSIDAYSVSDGKAGSYVQSYLSAVRAHESIGENRLKFSAQLSEMSEDLQVLAKECDKSRKMNKDLGTRLERGLQDHDNLVDKARSRFDSAAEELEKILLVKQGESLKDPTNALHIQSAAASGTASSSTNSRRTFGKAMSRLKGPKTLAQVQRQEEDVRSRMGQSSDAYRSQVMGAQAVRTEFFNLQLPRILRSLKESVDECDMGVQYHLSRYVYLYEGVLASDGVTVSPINNAQDGPGMKSMFESIDNREDFKTFMQSYAVSWQMSGQRGPKRDGPGDEGSVNARAASMNNAQQPNNYPNHNNSFQLPPHHDSTFGVDLADQMVRDEVEVPRLLEKCAEAIEMHGLDSIGIYRLSGTISRVQRLKARLDREIDTTDLLSDENLTDINDIAAVLKLWLRELPEPLLTWDLYHGFVEAAKIDNDRLRHIRLHERVNELPDPNYATLKFLMGHLHKVQEHEDQNQMGVSNLAIVFGPNLLRTPPSNGGESTALADMQWQCKCVETILQHYQEIFVAEE